jgi:transposase
MSHYYTQAFKEQAVKKVLLRAQNVTIEAIAKELGVSCSALYDWIPYFNPYEYETCRYVRKGRVGNKNNRRKVISPLTLKIIQSCATTLISSSSTYKKSQDSQSRTILPKKC